MVIRAKTERTDPFMLPAMSVLWGYWKDIKLASNFVPLLTSVAGH